MVAQRLEGKTRAEIATMAVGLRGPHRAHGLRGGVGRFPGLQRHRAVSGADPLRDAGLAGRGSRRWPRTQGSTTMKTARFWQAAETPSPCHASCVRTGAGLPTGARSRCFGRVNHGGDADGGDLGLAGRDAGGSDRKEAAEPFSAGKPNPFAGDAGLQSDVPLLPELGSEPSRTSRGPPSGQPVLPEEVAQAAVQGGIPSVAATYNEPAVWAEYAMDIADACHEQRTSAWWR